jgi:hypothetical protein
MVDPIVTASDTPDALRWTVDAEGRTNNSPLFHSIVETVTTILRGHRLGEAPEDTARIIVARLAHSRGLGPVGDDKERP